MKRTVSLFLVIVLLSLLPFVCADAPSGKLTLMVYMCGSNLESIFGSASLDLKEMTDAEIGPDVSVLVMIGGSAYWDAGYKPGKTYIVEIRDGKQRVVWEDDKMNMGESATLTWLMTFAQENRPAEDYALVLWDHGGGPMEGVCWDELFSLDNLTLKELTDAVADAHLPGKLKWIGFDACLMGSLEVAALLSPYAEYMVASQETEPGFGWNYSFLTGIEKDQTGADSGKRIIDTFFEGHENYRDILTLSCLDLSKTEEITDEMDLFFTSSNLNITAETFPSLSMIRGNVTGFGKAVRGAGENGYDLVDAKGIFESLGKEAESTGRLADLLESFVVYSRSNEEGTGGVSVYHPYINKQMYLESWREAYRALHFSAGYTDYISTFGDILTGKVITDWSKLTEIREEAGTDKETLFALPLTPGQQEDFSSAQLLIMYDLFTGNELSDNCALIYSGKADMDPQGIITAEYAGQSLYIERENGDLYGPVSFNITDDGQYAYVQMIYMAEGKIGAENNAYVLYFLDMDPGIKYPEIARTRVWDHVTQTYTNRLMFDESQYSYIHLLETGRKMPVPDDQGLLPMYYEWESGDIPFVSSLDAFNPLEMSLPEKWRFRWMDEQMTGKQLYAVFQVTDIQQNVFCSLPILVSNPNRKEYAGIRESDDNPDVILNMEATVINSPTDKWVQISIDSENKTNSMIECMFSKLIINGERIILGSSPSFIDLDAKNTEYQDYVAILPMELYGIDQIETVETTLTIKQGDNRTQVPVLFRFDGCEVRPLWQDTAPLAETEQDDVMIRLLSLDSYSGSGIEAFVLVRNESRNLVKFERDIVIDQVELNGLYSKTEEIPSGFEAVEIFRWSNGIHSSDNLGTVDEEVSLFTTSYISDHTLQHEGIDRISNLTLYGNKNKNSQYQNAFTLRLEQPWELQDGERKTYLNTAMYTFDPDETPQEPEKAVALANNNQYSVSCKKIFAGKNGASLKLEIANRTDNPLKISAQNAELNGLTANIDGIKEWTSAPGATAYVSLTLLYDIKKDSLPEDLETIMFELVSDEQKKQEKSGAVCKIAFPESLKVSDDALWIRADRIVAEETVMPDVEIPILDRTEKKGTEQLLVNEVVLAENAKDQGKWISASLTEEQKNNIANGMLFLIRPIENGTVAEVVSIHSLSRITDGDIGSRCSGLILCPEKEQGIRIVSYQGWVDDAHLEVNVVVEMGGLNEELESVQNAKGAVVQVDFENDHAGINEAQITGAGGSMTKVLLTPFAKGIPDTPEGRTVPVLEWVSKTWIRILDLEGTPLQLMLRPITEEDDLYCIFSITEKDGTEYSLPMFPYPLQ